MLVPWFSRNEWLDAYENAFGVEYHQWKAAYDLMNVWNARVLHLPMGVEATMQLLKARCLNKTGLESASDSQMDVMSKRQNLCFAVASFVSTVMKSAEDLHYEKKTWATLAKQVNLPLYLVNLRNDIFHSYNHDSFNNTIEKAFQDCLTWIKINYWDLEHQRMEQTIQKPNIEKDLKEENSDQIFNNLENVCNEYTADVCGGRPKIAAKLLPTIKEVATEAILDDNDRFYKTIVKCLINPLTEFERNINESDRKFQICRRVSFLDKIQYAVIGGNSLNFLYGAASYCNDTAMIECLLEWVSTKKLDYTKFVKNLLNQQDEQISALALRIMKEKNTFTIKQCNRIQALVDIMQKQSTEAMDCSETTSHLDNEIYTIDSIQQMESGTMTKPKTNLPLGILCQEQNHLEFYKKLILNIS